LRIAGKEVIDLLKKVIPVGIKGEKGIIEVPLKNTIGTIHRTIGDRIDHMVTAADMLGGPRTGLQPPSIKTGDEEMSLAYPNGIWHRKKLLNQYLLVLNPFYRDMGKAF
jgi:hypothetical protein